MVLDALIVASLKPCQKNPMGQNLSEGKRVQHALVLDSITCSPLLVTPPDHNNLQISNDGAHAYQCCTLAFEMLTWAVLW